MLLAGSAAAIVFTQDLRDEGAVASSIHWKSRPGPRYRVCFRLTRDDEVDVAVVGSSGQVVRVLAESDPLQGGDMPHCFDWDGLSSTGQPVSPDRYHLQLSLADADRVAVSGESLNISAAKAARLGR